MGGFASARAPVQDYRAVVSNLELFTCRFNYRVVFSPLKLCVWCVGLRRSRTADKEAIRVGALTVTHYGVVDTSPLNHNRNYIFPMQYRAFRGFWSTVHVGEGGVGVWREG